MVRVLCRWAKFVGFGCLQDLGAPLREPMCVSRRPVKEELFILRYLSRVDCSNFLSWSICAIDVGLSTYVPGMFAMAASLFRAMMCFLKIRVYLFLLFPRDNVFFVS